MYDEAIEFKNYKFYILYLTVSLFLPIFWYSIFLNYGFQFFIGSLLAIYLIFFKIPPFRTNSKLEIQNKNSKLFWSALLMFSITNLLLIINGLGSLNVVSLNFDEILVGVISTFILMYANLWGTYQLIISKHNEVNGIKLKIERKKIFYSLIEEVFIENNSKILFKERSALNLYHTLEISDGLGANEIYIAPGNHQGINLLSKIIEILQPLPFLAERINSLRIPGIALPRGVNVNVTHSNQDLENYKLFRDISQQSNFRFYHSHGRLDLVLLLILEVIIILALALSAIIPIRQFIRFYQMNDLYFIQWAFVVLIPTSMILILLYVFFLGLIAALNGSVFYETDSKFVIEYQIPIINPIRIDIPKALKPEFILKNKYFSKNSKQLILQLRNNDKKLFFEYFIGELKN